MSSTFAFVVLRMNIVLGLETSISALLMARDAEAKAIDSNRVSPSIWSWRFCSSVKREATNGSGRFHLPLYNLRADSPALTLL
jgi:hypothetical protein